MAANEVPKKIYLNPLLMEDGESIVRRCTFERQRDCQVEYTRTDTFVKMAVGRLKHYLDNSVWVANDVGVREKEVIIEDFENYLKEGKL